MDRNHVQPSKVDRKTIERNRRNLMKDLCSRLSSLLPPRETTSLQDQLEGATEYIKNLQANLEKMNQKKKSLSALPSSVDVRLTGPALEVLLVTGTDRHQAVFTDAVRVLSQEGADIVTASFSVQEDQVFHTIHSKIGDQPGQDSSGVVIRISEKLRKFLHDFN